MIHPHAADAPLEQEGNKTSSAIETAVAKKTKVRPMTRPGSWRPPPVATGHENLHGSVKVEEVSEPESPYLSPRAAHQRKLRARSVSKLVHQDDRVNSGVLTVTVRSAEITWTPVTAMMDRLDPYVVIQPAWTKNSFVTLPVNDGHKRPVWNEKYHRSRFNIKFPGAPNRKSILKLRFNVIDKNRFTRDTTMGVGELNVVPFIDSPTVERTKINISLNLKERQIGHLHIELSFIDQTTFVSRHSQGRGTVGSFLAVVSEGVYFQQQVGNVASSWVILPSSTFRKRWDMITILGLFYCALFTPLQIAFLSDEMTVRNLEPWWFIFVLDRLIDMIFLFDIIVNFRSAWIDPEGVVSFDARQGAYRYLTTWFTLDLVSALPFDFLDLIPSNSDDPASNAQLRIPRLVRLFRLVKVTKVLRASRIFKRFEANMSIKYALLRLLKFLVVIVVVAHWNACGFYLVASMTEGEFADTWARSLGMEWGETNNPVDKYLTSLYWAMMTLTTIGYGDIFATNRIERIYVTLSMMICALIFAYVVGTMCSLVQGLNSNTLFFQNMMDDINDYMHRCGIPHSLRRRVRNYCLYQRSAMIHRKEQEIWQYLSPSLRLELAHHQYLPVLEQVPYFQHVSPHFISELACHLLPRTYGPNEVLVTEGMKERQMYILNKGRVHVEKSLEGGGVTILATLSNGTYFGEQALIFGTYRNATVRSHTFCEVCLLTKSALDEVLDKYPDERAGFKSKLIRTMWRHMFKNPQFREALIEHAKRRQRRANKRRGALGISDRGRDTSSHSIVKLRDSNNNNNVQLRHDMEKLEAKLDAIMELLQQRS